MSSVPRHGSDVPPGGLADALDRACCLIVAGMFDHEMRESVTGELASHMAVTGADDPARALPDRGATGREPDPRGFDPGDMRPTGSHVARSPSPSRIRLFGCGKKRTNTSMLSPQVADPIAPELRAMVGYKMHCALGSCVGADQARRRKP